jgi:hypothetical protein
MFYMIFNKHGSLAGTHAFLSASNYHWLNYSDDKLEGAFFRSVAARRGIELHEYAQRAIALGIRQAEDGTSLSNYINDGIGYRMTPEQILFYSNNCYGQADTIGFRNKKLRIHDLKTGMNEASFAQLEIYAALFCLEYGYRPFEFEIELRIYQNNETEKLIPDADGIFHIMEKIVYFSKMIDGLRQESA